MDRMDSGFDESYRLKAPVQESISVHTIKTTPTPPRNNKQTSIEPTPNADSSLMETRRPASENQSGCRRRSFEPRRKSTASSSENSTRPRGGGHSSKPSSRRTSCTLVDPSRPGRHYRIKSSQTVPTATTNRDIDDVLALHFRSCSLFKAPSYNSNLPSPTISGHSDVDTLNGSTGGNAVLVPAPLPSPDSTDTIPMSHSSEDSETTISIKRADTTMHWISPSTRKREYEKIDKANSGIRGFIRKIIPQCVSGPPPPRFYEKDCADVGSVRRYRMDVSDDEEEEFDVEVDEKSTALLRNQSRKVEPSRSKSANDETTRRSGWGCF